MQDDPNDSDGMTNKEPRGGLTSPILTGKQASVWTLIDQILVKYGPLGVMLFAVCYYIIVKDDVIAQKDKLLLEQQRQMVEITRQTTEALVKTSQAQMESARSVDQNTQTMARLVAILERQHAPNR